MTILKISAAFMLAAMLGAAQAMAKTETVTINNYTFSPAAITVQAGDTVVWNNQDSIPHTATALDGKSFDSGAIDPGATWSFVFSKAGAYSYRCAIHPDMQGSVTIK